MDTHIAAFSASDAEPEGRARIALPGESPPGEYVSEPDVLSRSPTTPSEPLRGGRFGPVASFLRGGLARLKSGKAAGSRDSGEAADASSTPDFRDADLAESALDRHVPVSAFAEDKLAPQLIDAAEPKELSIRSNRRLLLAGAAIVVMVGGVAFLASPYNPPSPQAASRVAGDHSPSAVQAAITENPGVLAPAARVARSPQDARPSLVLENPPVQSPSDQFNEIVKLRRTTEPAGAAASAAAADGREPVAKALGAGSGPVQAQVKAGAGSYAPPLPAAPAAPALAVVVRPQTNISPAGETASLETGVTAEAAAAPPEIGVPATQGLAGANLLSLPTSPAAPTTPPAAPLASPTIAAIEPVPVAPSAPTPTLPVAHGPKSAPERLAERHIVDDPIMISATLHPAAMTPPEQVEVLNLVAKLGTLISDMKIKDAAMQARIEAAASRADAAVADFDRRLALAEARGSITAAMGGEAAPAPPTVPPDAMARSVKTHVLAAAAPAASPAPADTAVPAAAPRYRVTAASPGLAMLSPLDRSGGDGAQPLQVAVGDQVPGYGRILSIQQRGSAWIVQTDRGPDKGAIQ